MTAHQENNGQLRQRQSPRSDSSHTKNFVDLPLTYFLSLPLIQASPHQAACIAKCSAMKQALPNTTDAEVGKPKVAKERKKQIEQRPPLSVRSSRSSSPTKPTTPCSSLSALAGESLRMNVGLDRGIKTSSTGRERIGESVTEMKAGVGQTVHVAKVKPIVRVRVLVQDRTVWDLLLRALEASNQPGRSRSEVYYLTKGRVSGIRGFAIPVSLRRCSRPKSHVMLSETPRTTRIEDAPLVRKHNGLACGANGDLRLQEGKRQPPSSKDFFEGGALLYSFARETST
ncbi:hypothetical protein Tco_0027200 [Tanacetum coccineum]